MDGSHEEKQVFFREFHFQSLAESPFPAWSVSSDTIPIKRTNLPISQLVNIVFGARRRGALVAVMKIVRQFPQRRTRFNLMCIKQPVLGEFDRVRLSSLGLFDRSDL